MLRRRRRGCNRLQTVLQSDVVRNSVDRPSTNANKRSSSDLPRDEIRSKLKEVSSRIQEVKQTHEGATSAKGGSIWLVSTFKDLDKWQPEAGRELADVEWGWAT